MSQQQTVLRVQTNVQDKETIAGTFDITQTNYNLSVTGSGTQFDPFSFSHTGGTDYFYITIFNQGSSGTLYYNIHLGDYTGTSINFYENYYSTLSYRETNALSFTNTSKEYAVQDIIGQIELPSGFDAQFYALTKNTIMSGTSIELYFIPDDVYSDPIQTYEFLDLYDSIPIKINKSFAELQDISKRNSDYSIGLQIPGSKKNNKFFESFYNVDSSTLFFDVTKRVPCDVLIEDEQYFNGYLRLNKVSVIDSKIEYDVTLYSNVGDLFGKIGNNLLKDLDFNDIEYHFNHYFTAYNVTAAWRYNVMTEDSPPLFIYPIVHNGYQYTGDTPNYSGGTAQSQSRLFTSTVVGTYVDYAAFTGSPNNGKDYYINSPKHPIFDTQLKPSLNIYSLIQLMFKNYGYTIKSDFFNTPWFKLLYLYGYFSSDATKFSYNIGNIQTLGLSQVDILFYVPTYGEFYAIPVVAGTGIPCYCSSNITFHVEFNDPNFPYYPYNYIIDGTITAGTSGYTESTGLNYIPNLSTSNATISNNNLSYLPSAPNTIVQINEYDYVNFNQVIDPIHKQIDLLSSIAKKFNLVFIPDPDVPNQIIIEPYTYYIGSGNVYDWSDKISFDKGFTVEPALNYIESELILTDLEDGDDGNKQFKDKNNRIYGQNNVFNPTDFKSQQKKIETVFSPEVIRKWDDNIGIPLPINYVGSSSQNTTTNAVNYQYKGLKSKLKLFYNLGNFSPFLDQVGESYVYGAGVSSLRVNSFLFRVQQSDGTNPLNETYALSSLSNPVISHTMPMGNPDSNKINNDSICNLFNSEAPQDLGLGYPTYNTYTDNDIYNLFYINRINNLYDKTTRFLKGNFYLKLSDIKNLKSNDLIKIQDQYFTWNKIDGYNLTNRELTKVELIQFNSPVNTYPTRYFFYQYPNGDGTIFKFKTDFISSSLKDTYFYWSLYYDYMVGVLGGNVSGITSSYAQIVVGNPTQYDVQRYAYNMWEVSENDYNTSGITHTYDNNNNWFIDTDYFNEPTLDFKQSLNIWVYTNNSGFSPSKVFLNVASGYTAFTGYCSSNGVTLSAAPAHGTPATPTPTPTPTSTPITNRMRGSLLLTYDETNAQIYTPFVEVFVNNELRNLVHNNVDNLYSTPIYSGDVVNIKLITTSGTNTIDVVRRDYTTDDQGEDNGIRDTYITGVTGASVAGIFEITFTATTIAQDYNFEYLISTSTSFPATPTPTPTITPTNTITPSITPTNTSTPTVTPTNTPSITPTNTPTLTPTNTSTPTNTPTNTPTVTPTNTSTPTNTPTVTATNTPTNTSTPTNTPSITPTNTPSITPTKTPINTPTNTVTPTATPTLTPSNTPEIYGGDVLVSISDNINGNIYPSTYLDLSNNFGDTGTFTDITLPNSTNFLGVSVSDTGYMIAVNTNSNTGQSGYVFTSGDRGTSWSINYTLGLNNWRCVTQSTDSTVQVIGGDGILKYSTNYGSTWNTFNDGISKRYDNIRYASNKIIYAIGSEDGTQQYLYKINLTGNTSTNLGISSLYPNQLAGLGVSEDGKIILVNKQKEYYLSTNSGSTFSIVNSISTTGLSAYHYCTVSSTGKYQFAFYNSSIYYSSNSGTTWSQSILNGTGIVASTILDIQCNKTGKIVLVTVLVGSEGTVILQSKDYGVSFVVSKTFTNPTGLNKIGIGGQYPPVTPSNTPTISLTPSITPTTTVTPSITPTNTPTPTSSASPLINPYTYLSAVSAAGGTTGTTVNNAVINLCNSLNSSGLNSKLYALYPFVGGTAPSHALNAINPIDSNSAFRLTFSGGWTHNASGITANGSNAYANTYLTSTVDLLDFNKHYAFYNNQISPNNSGWDGVWDSAGTGSVFGCNLNTGGKLSLGLNFLSGNLPTVPDYTTCFIGNITGTTNNKFYQNGNLLYTRTGAVSAFSNSLDYYIGCLNVNGTPQYYSNNIYGFYCLGSSLTPTEVTNLNTIINTFITDIGR